MLLEEVSKQAVQVWIHELNASGLEPKTVRNIVKMLKSILNWNDVGTRDWKLRLPELPDEQRWFTPDEVVKLIEAADKFPKRRAQYSVLFRLAYASGLHPGELFGLHVPDFDFDAGTMRVERGTFRNLEGTPKTRKGRRTIYLDAKTLDAVGLFSEAGRLAGFL
jgi:integrase